MSVGWFPGQQTILFTVQDRGTTSLYRVGADDTSLSPVVEERGQVASWS